jgi:SHS2 domain-containing protein
MPYKFLEHTADVKILVEEKSLEDAFVSSALAVKEIILDYEKLKIKSEKSRFLSIEGKDLGDLLYNFLEEFIYLLDAEGFILSEIESLEITKEKNKFSLDCHVIGDRAGNYKFVNKVKAVTFNEMKVQEDKKTKKVIIQFVLDV